MARRAYIVGAGLVSALGLGLEATAAAVSSGQCGLVPLDLFPLMQGHPLPAGQVGQIPQDSGEAGLPRTHHLVLAAAKQALEGAGQPPEAIILGCTTGGMLHSETLLRRQVRDPASYRYHGLDSVSRCLARAVGCRGPALTISTACSSGAVALALALALLKQGRVRTVLAGGVDSLCRLTYFGFHSLQLVDAHGCRPLDQARAGMSVGEGAGLLLLSSIPTQEPLAELLGAGLSCDAHHATAPQPDGDGAARAMTAALTAAGLGPNDIDYINLHGTGTVDNDQAEARAIQRVFATMPPLSSTKGATGHTLAAAGAIEAILSTLAIGRGVLPGTTGCRNPDPALGLQPLAQPVQKTCHAVLSNSLGFGGNNASLVLVRADHFPAPPDEAVPALYVHGYACLTGAGLTDATVEAWAGSRFSPGQAEQGLFSTHLPPRLVRRLKRLPRMVLALAQEAAGQANPQALFLGTGWGALSETHDFLARLQESAERFPSPTDFIASVHNAPAGQAAILLKALGVNLTTCGGDASFAQALLAAQTLVTDQEALVLGADEGHPLLSPLFDPSVRPGALADGGAALRVSRESAGALCRVAVEYLQEEADVDDSLSALVAALGGKARMQADYDLVVADIPANQTRQGEAQLCALNQRFGLEVPVLRSRELSGEFASAAAVAAVLAVLIGQTDRLPALVPGLHGPGLNVLLLGLGSSLSAIHLGR